MQTRAPGRVNLIGEHTDYTGGFVMPLPIARETRVSVRPALDRRAVVASFGSSAVFELDALPLERTNDWRDYARGMFVELQAAGIALQGAEFDVTSDVPIGAGLSSSASFEIALGRAALAASGASMDAPALALLAQRAESRHTGTRCGIMDQFAVTFGRAGSALFLDTRTLEYEAIAMPPDAAVVICNTMVKHRLAGGDYNARRRECENAAALLRERYPDARELRDVPAEQVMESRSALGETLFARALHVTSENRRVLQAAGALRERDAASFGALMYASHESLRDLFAVSCAELDIMVECAREIPGVFGARMTGGGFGGCTVNLVRADAADAFRDRITHAYFDRTGIRAEIYDA